MNSLRTLPLAEVKRLAKVYGATVSDRTSVDYIYNGEDIAAYHPVWRPGFDYTDETPMGKKRYDTYQLVHDIAHYVVASKTQRELPEFGLPLPFEMGSNSTLSREIMDTAQLGAVTDNESQLQEAMAFLVGNMICDKYNLYIPVASRLNYSVYAIPYTDAHRVIVEAQMELKRMNVQI